MFKELWHGLAQLIFPDNCINCKRHLPNKEPVRRLCSFCLSAIELNHSPFCQRCSRSLKEDPSDSLCRACRRQLYFFDKAYGVTFYNAPMKHLIHLYKYGNKTGLTGEFVELIENFIQTYHLKLNIYDALVPIPLHRTRLRERGYNQAQLIAEGLSKKHTLPLIPHALVRVKATKNQALLNQKERWTNIQAAFKIRNPSALDGKKILLVDDLLTTGATLSEAARTLKAAGTTQVDALALAITQ